MHDPLAAPRCPLSLSSPSCGHFLLLCLARCLVQPRLLSPLPPESACGRTVSSRRGSWRSLRSSTVTSPRRIWGTSGRSVAGRTAPSTRWSTNPRARSWLSRWPADRHASPEFTISHFKMLPLPSRPCKCNRSGEAAARHTEGAALKKSANL